MPEYKNVWDSQNMEKFPVIASYIGTVHAMNRKSELPHIFEISQPTKFMISYSVAAYSLQ